MTNCELGHTFYETYTPFNHVYCSPQTLSFSPIVHRVQDYIGSAVVEKKSKRRQTSAKTKCRGHADKIVISTVCLVHGLRWFMWEHRWSLKLA